MKLLELKNLKRKPTPGLMIARKVRDLHDIDMTSFLCMKEIVVIVVKVK